MKTEALKALDTALWRARAAAVRTSDHHIQIGHAIDAFYQLKEALAQPEQEPVGEAMTAHRAAYFMERFKHEEKLLGPNEQAALNFVISMLEAQPEQEPVAYIKAAELEELKHCNGMSLWAENAAIHTEDSISKQLLPSGHVPVYTTPPRRKPLTEAQICALRYSDVIRFARAIEAAHGIKEKNT